MKQPTQEEGVENVKLIAKVVLVVLGLAAAIMLCSYGPLILLAVVAHVL